MIVEMGRVPPDGDGILLGTAFGLVPVGDKADDFLANLGLGDGLEHVGRSHATDDTANPLPGPIEIWPATRPVPQVIQ